ncbi:MAG: branched-chain amino acid aminotransferase [Deltaproteobacteria bacterium]|nr:branched-chain amino acid aminotransferase [Deltaproteobacteria bacterium]
MEIKRTILPQEKRKPLYEDPMKLQFGKMFTDHWFAMPFNPEDGWHDPEIKPLEPLSLHPAANIFHYCQEVFEGQKAYKSPNGETLLFRPEENARRFRRSLQRMCMAEVPEEIYQEALFELVKIEERWIPRAKGTSLYIRPTVIGTEAALGVKPSAEYLFFILLSPVGPYFPKGFSPINLWVSDTFSRAVEGGTGEAKTGGNYAASLMGGRIAKENGYDQVLWLDAKEHRYVEEGGAMNIFFVIDGKLSTPALTGSILHGITRKSVLEMASDLGITAEERRITIDEIMEGVGNGRVSEAFCAGTAAIITPVGRLGYKGLDIPFPDPEGPWARRFYDMLCGIQFGEHPDTRGWVKKL